MFETVDRWNFTRKVLNSEGLILLSFWTPWNAECQRVSKLLHEIASHVGDEIQILKIDWDAQRKLAEELDVYGVPTLLIFNNGKLVRRYSGILTPDELLNIIKMHSKKNYISKGVKNL